MNNQSFSRSARPLVRYVPMAAALLSMLLAAQGCSFANRSWNATKHASTNVAHAVWPGADHSGESLSLEYQWQVMTADTRGKVAKKLSDGLTNIDEPGFAGRAACMVFAP